MRTAWTNFQIRFEDQIPLYLELHNEVANDTCIGHFSGAIFIALAESPTKCRTRAHSRPLIPTGIQDEIGLKDRMRRR